MSRLLLGAVIADEDFVPLEATHCAFEARKAADHLGSANNVRVVAPSAARAREEGGGLLRL